MKFWNLFKKEEAATKEVISDSLREYYLKNMSIELTELKQLRLLVYIEQQVRQEALTCLPKPTKGTCKHKYHKKGRTEAECKASQLARALISHEMDINAEIGRRFLLQEMFERFAKTIKNVPKLQLQYHADANSCKECLARDKKIYTLEQAKIIKFHFGCCCYLSPWSPDWEELEMDD